VVLVDVIVGVVLVDLVVAVVIKVLRFPVIADNGT
jgi:hypothetical protein